MFYPSDDIICPVCEADVLRLQNEPGVVRCVACGHVPSRDVLETLCQIKTLPDAAGGHACDCGHPEMRHLPDGIFHCPACGSEVQPLKPAQG